MAFSRERFWGLLGAGPLPPARLVSRSIEAGDGFSIERLTFDLGDAAPVRAILTRPTAIASRAPAILYMHAHGGRYDVGVNEILDGQTYMGPPLGPVFARQGYVTLMLEMPLFGERATISEGALAKALLWRGRTLMGQMLSELTAALGYLAGRDDVDPTRIAAYGISMGCTHAFMLAALDDRIAAVAQICCFADYGMMIDLGAHDGHGHYLTIPGMLLETSIGEICGAIAPRPQLICLGEDDSLTPAAAVTKARCETEASYLAAGHPGALEFFIQPGVRHQETPEMRERVLGFLRRVLA